MPFCGTSQIIFNNPFFRSEETLPIITEIDFPADDAMISLSCQEEPHDGHKRPPPAGLDPKKASSSFEQRMHLTQILLCILLIPH